jgi:hypothetical protein
MYSGAEVVARGVVEDLSAGKAAARVVQTSRAAVQLDEGARVQFANAPHPDGSPASAGKGLRFF